MGRRWGSSRIGLIALLVVCSPMLFSLGYPVVATGDGSDASRSAPEECVAPPNRTGAAESGAAVSAVATLGDGGTINITYDVESGAGTGLEILPTRGIEVVDANGFERVDRGSSGFGPGTNGSARSGLRVDRSATSHWIEYRTAAIGGGAFERDPYPRGEGWAIAPIPEHADARVALEPADSGYVGSSTLYLGEFERESTTVGCQTVAVVVPAETDSSFDVDARLTDLERAARRLPGQKYETVHVFVSPAELGDDSPVGGFVRGQENEIVVATDSGAVDASVLWIHEYVHTLQDYRPRPDLEWTVEAVATYTALETAVETGRITPLEYDLTLSRLMRADDGERSLANTSAVVTPYARGTAVVARIDADLEAESDRSVSDVLEWSNEQSEPGYDDLKAYLENDAGLSRETVASYDRLVLGDEPVAVEYRHAPGELSPVGWAAVSLLLADGFRAFSAVALTGISATLVVARVYARLRMDPENIDF